MTNEDLSVLMELYVELTRKLNEVVAQVRSIEIKKKVIETVGVLINERINTTEDRSEASRCDDLLQNDYIEELRRVSAKTPSIDEGKILDVMYLKFKLKAIKKVMEEEDSSLFDKLEKETIFRQAAQRAYLLPSE